MTVTDLANRKKL